VLPSQGRSFFNDNLRLQAYFMLQINRVLQATAEAMRARQDHEKCLEHLSEAQRLAAQLPPILKEADHGRFASWHTNETVFSIARIRQDLSQAAFQFEAGIYAP
jgi:tRNA G37 N-methylase TrmD